MVKKIKKYINKIGLFEVFLAILLITLSLLLLFYFFRPKKWIIVNIKITSDNVLYENRGIPFWLADSIKKGDIEYDGIGRTVVEILDIKSYESDPTQYPGYYKETYIKAKIQAIYDQTKQKYTYNSQDLLIGAPISIRPNGILINGLVTNIEGSSDKEKYAHKKVLVQIEDNIYNRNYTVGIRPWIVNAINIGDKIEGFDGEIIASVLDKKAEPAIKETIDNSGSLHLEKDPYLQDVYLTLDLLVKNNNGTYYFRDTDKVKIGNQIFLFMPKFDTKATIIDILN